jgi:hypothetical protein
MPAEKLDGFHFSPRYNPARFSASKKSKNIDHEAHEKHEGKNISYPISAPLSGLCVLRDLRGGKAFPRMADR